MHAPLNRAVCLVPTLCPLSLSEPADRLQSLFKFLLGRQKSCSFSGRLLRRYPDRDAQYLFFRHYLCPEDPASVSESALANLYVEANCFALASHLYWGVWALVQVSQTPSFSNLTVKIATFQRALSSSSLLLIVVSAMLIPLQILLCALSGIKSVNLHYTLAFRSLFFLALLIFKSQLLLEY